MNGPKNQWHELKDFGAGLEQERRKKEDGEEQSPER